MQIESAQADMRHAYFGGATGTLYGLSDAEVPALDLVAGWDDTTCSPLGATSPSAPGWLRRRQRSSG